MNHMRRAVLLFAFGLCIMAATHPAFGGSTLVPGASTGHEASIDGKIDPRLLERLRSLESGQRISVSIWLNLPAGSLPQRRARTSEQYWRSLHAAVSVRQRPILRALARMGVKASGAAFAPVVFAKLTRAQIYAMARRPDVGKIYGPERNTLF